MESQPDKYNLILKNPETGELVDNGVRIPLNQILAGPRRAKLAFAVKDESDVRPLSQMLESTRTASGDFTKEYLAGRRRGWGTLAKGSMVAYQTALTGAKAKDVSIGHILVNERDRQTVMLQPYKAELHRLKLCTGLVFRHLFGIRPFLVREKLPNPFDMKL